MLFVVTQQTHNNLTPQILLLFQYKFNLLVYSTRSCFCLLYSIACVCTTVASCTAVSNTKHQPTYVDHEYVFLAKLNMNPISHLLCFKISISTSYICMYYDLKRMYICFSSIYFGKNHILASTWKFWSRTLEASLK